MGITKRVQRSQNSTALADQMVLRAAGAALIPGNRIRLLKDAAENYPAWIAAIESAEKWIHFETYIIHEDTIGRQFADLLSAKARKGVHVRLIYDWVGSLRNASSRFWKELSAAGVDVRCFNRLSIGSPLGWLNRDHRKMLSVDGRLAFVAGLCVGQRWAGYPDRGVDPWRDTGIEIEGPALVEIERAFSESWLAMGSRLPPKEGPSAVRAEPVGDVAVRVIGTIPNSGSLYRLDQFIAALARHSIWLSDAYFVGTAPYIQSLRAAAKAGVDVRLLIPGSSDVPILRSISRAGLRPLLEGGVRIFEWDGPMMHAKTAVVDGRWARVGSTNLNPTSWIGNWELDVIVEDKAFARQMEAMYIDDLGHSTEVVLKHFRPRLAREPGKRRGKGMAAPTYRTATGIMRLGYVVGAAITHRRELGPAEAVVMVWGAVLLVLFAVVGIAWPRTIAVPLAVVCLWLAASLLLQAYRLHASRKRRR
jgi:cardiolipin synthase